MPTSIRAKMIIQYKYYTSKQRKIVWSDDDCPPHHLLYWMSHYSRNGQSADLWVFQFYTTAAILENIVSFFTALYEAVGQQRTYLPPDPSDCFYGHRVLQYHCLAVHSAAAEPSLVADEVRFEVVTVQLILYKALMAKRIAAVSSVNRKRPDEVIAPPSEWVATLKSFNKAVHKARDPRKKYQKMCDERRMKARSTSVNVNIE